MWVTRYKPQMKMSENYDTYIYTYINNSSMFEWHYFISARKHRASFVSLLDFNHTKGISRVLSIIGILSPGVFHCGHYFQLLLLRFQVFLNRNYRNFHIWSEEDKLPVLGNKMGTAHNKITILLWPYICR